MRCRSLVILSQALLVVHAQYDLSPNTCIDPSGFQSCISDATTSGGKCQQDCNILGVSKDICISACGCDSFTKAINCALSHCWNQVYSCGYQALVIAALSSSCPVLSIDEINIPYFPAPANAPGGCSCNLGAAFMSYLELGNAYLLQQCPSRFAGLEFYECQCCAYSGSLSSIPDICPGVNRESIPDYLDPANAPITTAAMNLNQCDSFLPGATCTAGPFNAPAPIQAVTPAFYALEALPTGTKVISNNDGALSSPISGNILTWSIVPSGTAVATAVNANGGSGSSGALGHAALLSSEAILFITSSVIFAILL